MFFHTAQYILKCNCQNRRLKKGGKRSGGAGSCGGAWGGWGEGGWWGGEEEGSCGGRIQVAALI